jgi:hypothetical protein
MNVIIFAVGILHFFSAVGLSIWSHGARYALAFRGLSAAAFLGYFIGRPLRSLEGNLEFITWLGIIYTTYWTRVVAASNPDTAQQDLQSATKRCDRCARKADCEAWRDERQAVAAGGLTWLAWEKAASFSTAAAARAAALRLAVE